MNFYRGECLLGKVTPDLKFSENCQWFLVEEKVAASFSKSMQLIKVMEMFDPPVIWHSNSKFWIIMSFLQDLFTYYFCEVAECQVQCF